MGIKSVISNLVTPTITNPTLRTLGVESDEQVDEFLRLFDVNVYENRVHDRSKKVLEVRRRECANAAQRRQGEETGAVGDSDDQAKELEEKKRRKKQKLKRMRERERQERLEQERLEREREERERVEREERERHEREERERQEREERERIERERIERERQERERHEAVVRERRERKKRERRQRMEAERRERQQREQRSQQEQRAREEAERARAERARAEEERARADAEATRVQETRARRARATRRPERRTRTRQARHRNHHQDQPGQNAYSGPPPTPENTEPLLEEELPPYREQFHKYLDVLSFDARFVPILRVNKSLVKNQKELQNFVTKFHSFNLFPSTIDPFKLGFVDDRYFDDLIPDLIEQGESQDQSRDLGFDVNSMTSSENIQLAIEISLIDQQSSYSPRIQIPQFTDVQ